MELTSSQNMQKTIKHPLTPGRETRLPEFLFTSREYAVRSMPNMTYSIVVCGRRVQWRYLDPTVVRFLRQSYISTLLGPIYVRSSLRARGEAHGHIYKQHLHKNNSWQHVYLSHMHYILCFHLIKDLINVQLSCHLFFLSCISLSTDDTSD